VTRAHLLAMLAASAVLVTPVSSAQETLLSAQVLSSYREFHLGASLDAVALQAGVIPEVRALHRRPEPIQELMWLPALSRVPLALDRADSARKMLFSFYNDQLFQIVVTYDREKTEGLTAGDMVEAISGIYGLPMLPATRSRASIARARNASDTLVAYWEDSQASLSLFRSSSLPAFGVVVLSKRLDTAARVATVETVLLHEQVAPQRETERQQNHTDESRLKQETARRANKATFRP
jgi:hypothetical protein